MMNFLTKFALLVALCGLFAGCSSDSGTSSDSLDLNVVMGSITDVRDGRTYKTVTIGTLTWMAENLNYAYNVPTLSRDSSSFCYNNEPDSCAKYGRLYLWSAAMDSAAVFDDAGAWCGYEVSSWSCEAYSTVSGNSSGFVRGVCPEGWHLPDSLEWETLLRLVASSIDDNEYADAGERLKSDSGWNENGNGSNEVAFSALPAGYYNSFRDSFVDIGNSTRFWSRTEARSASYGYIGNGSYGYLYDPSDVYSYGYLIYNSGSLVVMKDFERSVARSVRCVKDW